MSVRVLAAAAVLAFALPAAAQQAPAAPPAADAAAETAAAEAEAVMEAKAEAFEARMGEMREEMQAAVAASGGDKAKATADLDAIQARYQPGVDTFAGEVVAFLNSQLGAMPEDQRAQMTAMVPVIEAQVRNVATQIRVQAEAPAPAPSAPIVPATPQ
jgi:hypothetical protein